MVDKCAIFIDRGYLSKILKDKFNNFNVDYIKFCEMICSELKLERLRTYVYTCLPIIRNNNLEDIKRKTNVLRFVKNHRSKTCGMLMPQQGGF